MGLRSGSSWVRTLSSVEAGPALSDFKLFAILGSWYEGDVIGATVENAFAQGCEQVFVVDNESPDDTVARAEAAGATLALSFASDQYDEGQRIRLMNETVERISREDGSDHIWWLWLDADEFPHGPDGTTLRQYLEALDRRCRVVGTRYFNHFPTREPEYRSGRHPLDDQPACEEFDAREFNVCREGHWKHPLLRWDRDGLRLEAGWGFHAAKTSERLFESAQPIFTHHFPYRDRVVTTRRLGALCGNTDEGRRDQMFDDALGAQGGCSKRYGSLDQVYERNWSQVENLHREGSGKGVTPEDWSTLVGESHSRIKRWYDPDA
jgi:hypothetical protein